MKHDTSTYNDQDFAKEFSQNLGSSEWVLDWVESTFAVSDVFDEDDIKKYIKESFNPEDVFDDDELDQWAEDNGYVKKDE